MQISPEKLEGLLKSHYPFERIRFQGKYSGKQSDVWKITANGDCYAVKRSLLTCLKRCEQMLHLCRILDEAGLRVVLPIPTTYSTVCFESGAQLFFVYPWLEGERASEKTLGRAEAECFGKLLARMHGVLSQAKIDGQWKRRQPADRQETLAILSKIQDGLLGRGISEKDKLLVTVKEKMRLLETTDTPACVAAAYRQNQLILGDFQVHNIILNEQGKPGVIDLESFHLAPRIWDIAKACVFSFGKSPELIGSFLASYHATSPLRESELEAFVPLVLDYLLSSTWEWEEFFYNGNTRVDLTHTFETYSFLASQAKAATRDIKTGLKG